MTRAEVDESFVEHGMGSYINDRRDSDVSRHVPFLRNVARQNMSCCIWD
jgi:hypothetical protein